ncbi:MAG: squalene synthase HpnC [Bacillota bacterium]
MGQTLVSSSDLPLASQVSACFPPTAQAALASVPDEAAAQACTRQLTHTHYENFPVVSIFLPRHLRQDFCNVYAFCRVADDLGDEMGDPEQSLKCLAYLKQQTHACFAGQATTALFVALAATVRRHDLPIQPFLDLIDAFEQDQRVTRYDTFDQLLDYCRRSADPVGRLVLYMCGYRDAERQCLSDKICSALQLTNFWQDVHRDLLERDRIYLPRETMHRFSVTERQLRERQCDENYREMIRFEVERTAAMFRDGDALLPLLRPAVRKHITLFAQGGRAILAAIRRQRYDTLTHRPSLSKWQMGRLLCSALARHLMCLVIPGGRV